MGDHTLTTGSTQEAHPYRAVIRTVFALVVGLAPMLPGLVASTGLDTTAGFGAAAIAISAAVTRILAMPAVNMALATYVPWLAAAPK